MSDVVLRRALQDLSPHLNAGALDFRVTREFAALPIANTVHLLEHLLNRDRAGAMGCWMASGIQDVCRYTPWLHCLAPRILGICILPVMVLWQFPRH